MYTYIYPLYISILNVIPENHCITHIIMHTDTMKNQYCIVFTLYIDLLGIPIVLHSRHEIFILL